LSALQAWNLPFLSRIALAWCCCLPASRFIAFLIFVVLLVLLSRNILKLYADQRSRVLGSRLRSRMLIGALLLSLAPATFMFFLQLLPDESFDRPLVLATGQPTARRLHPGSP
jgi:two-component system nitrogen regulation sensor histidine kinase NtrY